MDIFGVKLLNGLSVIIRIFTYRILFPTVLCFTPPRLAEFRDRSFCHSVCEQDNSITIKHRRNVVDIGEKLLLLLLLFFFFYGKVDIFLLLLLLLLLLL